MNNYIQEIASVRKHNIHQCKTFNSETKLHNTVANDGGFPKASKMVNICESIVMQAHDLCKGPNDIRNLFTDLCRL